MSAKMILLAVLGVVQLTINITTMFITLPVKRSVRFSIGVLSVFTVAIFCVLYFTNQLNNDFVSLVGLAYLPVMLWLFKGPAFQKTFAFFLQYLLTTLQISFAVTVVNLISGNENNAATVVGLLEAFDNNADIVWAVIFIFCLFVVYTVFMIRFGRLVFQKLFTNDHPAEWLMYSFGAVLSFTIMVIIRNTLLNPWQQIFLLLFVLWSFMILCFAIINTHEKSKHRYEAAFARDIISSGRGHYEKMNEMYDTLRILRHDYKYHLDTIGELLGSGKETEAEKYLTEIQKQLSDSELANYCLNPVLNALLVNFSERCTRAEIKFLVDVSLPRETGIPNYEMCIILGNLLENAFTASTENNDDRDVRLKISTQGAHLAIMVKNNYNGEIIEDNGLPRSTKKDGGLGLRSVQAVTTRHGGEVMTEWDDKTFSAYALIRL